MPERFENGSALSGDTHRAIYSKLPLLQTSSASTKLRGSAAVPQKVLLRLAVLKAGSGSQAIECDLIVAELEDHQYQALSYVWGDEADVELIICCGYPLAIRRNLFVALNYLRQASADRILWIDAICIDQKNLRERGEQVSLMGRIYGAAQRVIVWLGEPRNEDADAFGTIMELSRSVPDRKQKLWSMSKSRTILPAEINSYAGLSRLQFRQLLVFLSRAWFDRVWVIQEVVRSKQAVVLCGNEELPWDKFVKVILSCSDAFTYLVAKYPHEAFDQVAAFDSLVAIDSLKKENEKMTLFAILCIASTFKSTDPRDKLFALLNLGNRSSLRIQPDYTSNYFDVFRQHVVYEMTQRNRLDYLARPPVGPSRRHGWPSWVPDWTEKSRSSYFCTAMNHNFRAAAETMPVLSVQGNVLCIRGKIVDTIAYLVEPMQYPRDRQEVTATTIDSEEIVQWLERCLSLLPLKIKLIPDAADSALEPLLRTFVCSGARPVAKWGVGLIQQRGYTTELRHSLEKLASALRSKVNSANEDALLKPITRLVSLLYPAVADRQFLRTTSLKQFGWVSKRAKEGDTVCILYGAAVPFVLRKTETEMWKIIGECYLDGLMEGQAIEMGSASITDFRIC